MPKSSKKTDSVIIKKYANRRLYDTSTSSYVTLDHLSELVRKEVDFEVRDAKSGEDLTRQVLTQIIFERETKGDGALPVNFLRQLIGFYGGGAQSLLPAWLEMSMNSFTESQERWTKSIAETTNPFSMFQDQARANMEMFENAMRAFSPQMSGGKDGSKGGLNPMDPMSIMRAQLEAMQTQLDAMSGKKP